MVDHTRDIDFLFIVVLFSPCPFEVDFGGLPVEDALIIRRPPRDGGLTGRVVSMAKFRGVRLSRRWTTRAGF